ncbi:MAG: hypothetical protein ACYST9_03850, partial [Planctomycetota bacterium]
VEKFEQQLTELYAKISKETHVDAVRFVADYIGRHRNRLKDALGKMPAEQMQRIVKIPLQYEPHMPGPHCFERINLAGDADPQKILDAAIAFDECVAQMYRNISHQPLHEDVKEFFENLQQMEENDELEIEKIKTMFAEKT